MFLYDNTKVAAVYKVTISDLNLWYKVKKMAILIGFLIMSFVFSGLVIFACMLSGRISRREDWIESYEDYQKDPPVPQVARQSYSLRNG